MTDQNEELLHSIANLKRQVEAKDAIIRDLDKNNTDLLAQLAEAVSSGRKRLPDDRNAVTKKFKLRDEDGTVVNGYATVGFYEDRKPGELFIVIDRAGSTVRGLSEAVAILTSIALQYGIPFEVIAEKMRGTRFYPDGFTGEGETGITSATSVLDYVFRWVGTVVKR